MPQNTEINNINNSNPENTNNINIQPPENMEAAIIGENTTESTPDNYSIALQNVKELHPRDQHKLMLEILDSQGELGQKFITHLYQRLETYLEQQNDASQNRKRRNTDRIDDVRTQTSKQKPDNEVPTCSNMDPPAPTIEDEVSSQRLTHSFPSRTQPQNTPTPTTTNEPHNYFPGATDKIKIPPITVIKHETYLAINDLAKQGKFKILFSKTERDDSIKIYPATIEDYRAITNTLEANNQEFVSRNIDETKLLKVVLRGVPKFADVNDIAQELNQQGFNIHKADRMYKKYPDGTKTAYALVLLQLPYSNQAKNIYNIKHVSGFAVKVEPKRTTMTAMQCHNCQAFGHNQAACRVNPRCHRCAGAHHFTKCTKPITTPATCCNCRGNHPANFSGCPRYPKSPNPPQHPTPHLITNPAHVQNNISYAQTLSGNTNPLINAISQLQMVLTAFLNTSATTPNV